MDVAAELNRTPRVATGAGPGANGRAATGARRAERLGAIGRFDWFDWFMELRSLDQATDYHNWSTNSIPFICLRKFQVMMILMPFERAPRLPHEDPSTRYSRVATGPAPPDPTLSQAIDDEEFIKLRERARRMVLLDFTAVEISKALGIPKERARTFQAIWAHERQARNDSERDAARGMLLHIYEKAQEVLQLAAAQIDDTGNPSPNFQAIDSMLARMEAIATKLTDLTGDSGPIAIARATAKAKAQEQERGQEFARDNPDLIPGLGFSSPNHPMGGGGGGQIQGGFIVFPKLPEAIELDRKIFNQARQLQLVQGKGNEQASGQEGPVDSPGQETIDIQPSLVDTPPNP